MHKVVNKSQAKQAGNAHKHSQKAGKAAMCSDLTAVMLSKGQALHWARELEGYSAHGWGHQGPLQGGHQHCPSIHYCCCTIITDTPVHAQLYLQAQATCLMCSYVPTHAWKN